MNEFNIGAAEMGVDILHHMPDDGSGVYIKQTKIPAGVTLQMHSHTFTHKSVLCAGSVLLKVNGCVSQLEAPAVLMVRSGDEHEVSAITDSVWLCVHATDELDPERIDHTLVGA